MVIYRATHMRHEVRGDVSDKRQYCVFAKR